MPDEVAPLPALRAISTTLALMVVSSSLWSGLRGLPFAFAFVHTTAMFMHAARTTKHVVVACVSTSSMVVFHTARLSSKLPMVTWLLLRHEVVRHVGEG